MIKPVRRVAATMKRAMGHYKSGGVRVSADVYRLISEGNRARSSGEWAQAARAYQAALSAAPGLTHIWVQLGHALKEQQRFDDAAEAYGRAESLGDKLDAVVQQGHVAKLKGCGNEAIRHYLRAYQARRDPDALRELLALVERNQGAPRDAILRALQRSDTIGRTMRLNTTGEQPPEPSFAALMNSARELGLGPAELQMLEAAAAAKTVSASAVNLADAPALIFDASDLISYFGNARLPTGIQRVQIATITGAFATRPPGSVHVCCFSDQGDSWSEVPPRLFLDLCALAVASGDRNDPDWIDAYTELKLAISLSPPFVFPEGAFLVNLGTSWWLQNYFLFVREAKRAHNIRYVPFVHDFIPIMTPEHCVRELTQDFISWALGAYQHADYFLVNSEATKRDLFKVADLLGHSIGPDDVAVIPLNARFGAANGSAAPLRRLKDWRLTAGKFVLIVSTIESRKNHAGALDAWLELIRKHGARNVPKLVCVGNRGWLNDAVYARIERSPALRERVVMLSGLSDDELALLYRTCRFTLYPSNYEGWGLPVTESLCYGKVPVVSDASSLPEAGGPFAVYFTAGSTLELTDRLERLMFDDAELARLEARIRDGFEPREWNEVADHIAGELEKFAARAAEDEQPHFKPPCIRPGAYYPITRNYELRIWKGLTSAEIFRSGTGWWWPDDWGCWTKASGGELSLSFPDGMGEVRGFIHLHAPPDDDCKYEVSIEAADFFAEGTLRPGEYRWVPCTLPTTATSGPIEIRVRGSNVVDLAERTAGVDARRISLGVAGFYFCAADDYAARAAFLEALATDSLASLAFNRER